MVTSPCTACGCSVEAGHRFCPSCGVPLALQADPGRGGASGDPQREALERELGSAYSVVRLLGRGGMGAVYLARETALDRLVAVKLLPPGDGAPALRERFRREARLAARLTHPGIVPLHTFGESGDVAYFVMGYVRGESLAARLRREGRLDPAEVRRIVAQVADALDHAHRQGIVHRDVKPDNVLMDDETGRPLLTDFGIARSTAAGHTLTEAGSLLGTPHYMSPEQVSGKAVDARSDVYALGVMAYAMLAGRLPFSGATVREVVLAHLGQEPPPLAELAPEAPLDLRAAITRCLSKDPADRFPDAGSLRDALGAPGAAAGVPESLAGVESAGFRLAAWWVAVGVVALSLFAWRSAWGLLVYGVLALAAVPAARTLGLLNDVALARRRGASLEEILRSALWPPRDWMFWYPRRWRRPGDVWDRLPAPVRRFRAVTTVVPLWAVLVLPAFSWTIALLAGETAGRPTPSPIWFLTYGWLATIAAIAVSGALQKRWLRRSSGLARRDQEDLLREPSTGSAFWSRPEIERLLLPPAEGPGPAGSAAPGELLAAIAADVQALTGEVRAAGLDALEAARGLLASLESLGQEKARLREQEITGRLAALRRVVAEARRGSRSNAVDEREAVRRIRALCAVGEEETARVPGAEEPTTVAQPPGGAGRR